MTLIEFTQVVGAAGIGLFYPIQNWRAFVTRKPVGLSFVAFSAIVVGVSGYLVLGIRLGTPIFWALNISNLVFASMILLLVWFGSPTLTWRGRVTGMLVLAGGLSALAYVNTLPDVSATAWSGWIGLIGIVTFYPIQNTQLFVKRDSTGLSFTAFLLLFVGLCSLTVFGVLIGDITVVLGNGITALGTIPILWAIPHWQSS